VRTIIVLIFAELALGMAACGGASTPANDRDTRVVAAFYPLAFAAEQVGGARVDVENLTPPGAEPHDLEISPKDVREIQSADLMLLLGHGFQPQLEDAAGSGESVVRLLDTPGLDLLPNGDPHVWLDPHRYELIVRQIGHELHGGSRTRQLVNRLRALDREYRRGLGRCARDEIVTSHEAFAYLAQRYGLRQVAITGLSPEAEPAPKDIEGVVDRVRETGATTVFFETLVSPRLAETVARESGARTAVLNPIEGLTDEQADRGEDYFSLMRVNLTNLRRALGCR
jgi:zinc transport system substrate-binding protein